MIARYDTECAICDGSIRPGDEIVRDADGDWVHAVLDECDAELAAQAAGVSRPVDICPLCNCQRPCWCPEAVQSPEEAAARRWALGESYLVVRPPEDARQGRDPFDGFL